MNLRTRLRFSIWGTIITAICCFTPLLVWLFAALGLGALTGYIDIVVLPLFALFAASTIVSATRLYLMKK